MSDDKLRRGDMAFCPGCGEQVRFDGEAWYLENRKNASAMLCVRARTTDDDGDEYVFTRHSQHIDKMIAERPDVVVTPFGRVDLRSADSTTKLLAAQYLAMERRRKR